MNGEHTKPVESRTEDHKLFAFPSEIPPACANGQDIPYGLTKRELFAAMAMQGVIASGQLRGPSECVSFAIQSADALLKELAK